MGTEASGREVLPIPDQRYQGLITYNANDPSSRFAPIEPLRPPKGAPNVLLVLLDDVGFGAASAFGGPCSTPVAERLAENGLKYNRFHTTALCSPTRAALLTGRNHHTVGMAGITEIATAAPGYTSVIPNSCASLAETLKLNGYSTAQFGKCHEVPVWETSPMGPFRQWPTGQGFEHFYGFIGGETNQWAPAIYRDTVPIEPENGDDPDYHFGEDMTDHAIDWIRQQKALMPDKPFFAYYAPGATHAPITSRPSGQGSTRANSTTGGMPYANEPSLTRRNWVWSPQMPNSQHATMTFRHGTTCPTNSSRSSPVRWRFTPGSWSTPTTRSDASWRHWNRWRSSTTR
jgi:hypothetical protein